MPRMQAALASVSANRGQSRGRYCGQGGFEKTRRQWASLGCPTRFAVRYLCLFFVSTLLMPLPIAQHATAQGTIVNVPPGSNLGAFQSSALNGNTLSLLGNETLSGSLSVPAGSPGLTINGNGRTITDSNGTLALPMNATPNLTLQNDTVTGSGNVSVISGTNLGGLNIPLTGQVTFSNINDSQSGSVIGVTSNGTVAIGSPGSTVVFINDTAPNGGAISVANAAVAISGSETFMDDKATSGNGGAINSTGSQRFTITDTGPMIAFIGNTAALGGGAIFVQNNSVTIDGNVELVGNVAMSGNGGAIDEESNGVTLGSAGSTVVVTGNTATGNGGAINSPNTAVTVNGAAITLQSNTAGGNGGALYENSGPVSVGDASGATVNIMGNTAGSNGGAIYGNNGAVTVNGNTTLTNNMAPSGSGGAIYDTNSAILISNSSGNVSIAGNKAGSRGGAVYEGGGGAVTIGNGGATIDITSNTVGSSGGAIYSQNGAVTITGSGITMQGNGASTGNGGAVYAGNGFTLNANGPATISSNAAAGPGGAVYLNAGTLSLNATGGDITFSGNTENNGAANAIYFNSGTASFNAASGNITFFDPIESNPNSGLVTVTKTGDGMVSFDGSERTNLSNIYANTTVQQGIFEVDNNAVYGATAKLSGSFTVNSGATLQGGVAGTVATNQFTLQGGATLNIAGRAPPLAPPSVFTIDANTATFQPGSTISFNTELNNGLTQNTDLLVLSGTKVDAPGGVDVTNVGGTGAYTPGDGIRLIEAVNHATTAPGDFLLTHEVVAGAFTYDLFRGGKDPSDFPNDWFLRNDFTVGPGEPEEPDGPEIEVPEEPGAPGELAEETQEDNDILHEEAAGLIPQPIAPGSAVEEFPIDPPPTPLPPGVYPIIGPELATYGVVQPIARQMGLAMLGTLHERIGDTLTIENAGADEESCCNWGSSGWARFFGQQIDNRYQSYVAPSASGQLLGVQAGFDIWRGSFIPGHRDAAGVYFAYGNTTADVDGIATNAAATAFVQGRTGTLDLNAYSGGAYWTHYGPGGWYLDAVLQGTIYTGTATTQYATLPTNGSGILTSLEAGYPIPLPLGPRFILEPQGQIIWQHTSFRQAFDGLSEISLGSTSGVTGRLGVRGQWSVITDGGQIWQPYLRANLWRNWGGNATTNFGGTALVPLLEESTQLEFAAGLTAKLTAILSAYVQGGYIFAINGATDGGRRQGVKGDIGLRLTFCHCRPLPPPLPVAAPAPAAARSYLVFFDWDKATLTDRARQIIREAADNSTHVQYTRIEVNGYTDTSGTPRYNMRLSLRRAHAVAGELVRDGVPASAISIRGFGDTHLLVPTGPGVREPQNRRVEIVLQ